ncbi:MAG: extradiol dioxygenase [Bacteroidetes bacterium]|nr:extradiol dioxygenase [Bacteroidota bacterium]
MTKDIWLNLPVKDVQRSKAFFTALGYTFDSPRDNEQMACLMIGSKKFVVMLFQEQTFKSFIQGEITDTSKSSEILISIDAESREEVDDYAKKVTAAGGAIYAQSAENQGWMYGCAFTDLDGHKWNVLYMDMTKMPK